MQREKPWTASWRRSYISSICGFKLKDLDIIQIQLTLLQETRFKNKSQKMGKLEAEVLIRTAVGVTSAVGDKVYIYHPAL